MTTLWHIAWACALVAPSALAAADIVDMGPALSAGFVQTSARSLRSDGFASRIEVWLRNYGGVRLSITSSELLERQSPDPRWKRFWDQSQNAPSPIPDHFGDKSLGDRSYYLDREGYGGYRVFAILGKGAVDLRLSLASRREATRIVYEPHDIDADRRIVRQVAARTLANIASRELARISDDPSTGAGRYARPDGVRFVELTPWARAKGWTARLNDDGIAVTLNKGDRVVMVNLASKDAAADGVKRTLSECPLWKEGRFLVAERDLAKLF